MNRSDYQWWGFRLRLPLGYQPTPVSRAEAMAFGMIIAALLCAAWAAVLILVPAFTRVWGTAVPVSLLALATATLLIPRGLLERAGIAAWMILSREKGDAGQWDRVLALAALVFAGFPILKIRRLYGPAVLGMLLAITIACLLLWAQERVCSGRRRWSFDIPEWLKDRLKQGGEEEKEGEEEFKDGIVQPDDGAQRIYDFKAGDQRYGVGVDISEELIAAVRDVNRKHGGALYHTDPQAAILMDRPPAENLGRPEIERLCAQILSIARKHRMTPLALANATLAFVQVAIPYGYDEDTTRTFEGGPFSEYGRIPVETLHDKVGDCECTSLLCASLLRYLGFDVALLMVTVPAGYHAAVGLSTTLLRNGETAGLDTVEADDGSGNSYLYGETATDYDGLNFGVIPAGWKEGFKADHIIAIEEPRHRAAVRQKSTGGVS